MQKYQKNARISCAEKKESNELKSNALDANSSL